jgi:hypothetical protein
MIPLLIAMLAFSNVPSSVSNDDSCDMTSAPAATLLLPFFDVSFLTSSGDTTLFTVTNVSSSPQIAHVTIWTDWAFPVLTFDIFLTGYDVQSINLYDVIGRGQLSPGNAAPIVTEIADPGSQPGLSGSNPNIPDQSSCANPARTLPPELLNALQAVLTTGLYNIAGTGIGCGAFRPGGTHTNARGYVTIDIVSDCTALLPTNPVYYTNQILFDNVLIGDYQQVKADSNFGTFAQASPMVHIRAIPEGGPAGFNPPLGATNLPYTFYDRYTPAENRRMDRRVPLPSTFAARWIESSSGPFQTNYKIWREGVAAGADSASCRGVAMNSAMPIAEIIRFDERENSVAYRPSITCCFFTDIPRGPSSFMISTSSYAIFPPNLSTDQAGWMYLNLNHAKLPRPSQNWVVVSMSSQGRYSVDFDAAQLGNGCSSAALAPSLEIGPAGGAFVCPPGVACLAPDPGDHPYSGTNITPR